MSQLQSSQDVSTFESQWGNAGRGAIARSSPWVYGAIVLAILAVLVADIYTPLGVAVWVVYLVPVSLSLWFWKPNAPPLVAVICTALMVATFLTDNPGVDRHIAQINRGFGVFTIWGIALVGYFFIKNKLVVYRQRWLQSAQTGLSKAMTGDQRLEELGQNILRFLCEYLGASAAACFAGEGGAFARIATYGVPVNGVPERFTRDDGLLGQAVRDARTFILHDVPDGYLSVGSALGRGKPRHLVIVPVMVDEEVNSVLELGFLQPVEESTTDLLRHVSESIGTAIRSANYRAHLRQLLEETQRQAEELQAQSEELRVANEELEEQSRALRESQSRLEEQQTELEQTNSQLEEQAQLLETQRDELEIAQATLQLRAQELEQASRYKSDFLANMSHELRTPLNSSLILAKLLADNPQGNLSDDQVKYAQTILAAGNDLLALINDILDLSKIEAGRMEIRAEGLELRRLVDDLSHIFRPLADQKHLQFQVDIAPNAPAQMHTDRQRLEQVLKNLISNAIKFTEKGSVSVVISTAPGKRISFVVKDTGIGIADDQQDIIFEAFRQADGTSHRRHGGTGLGLSISRELARLLGGDIQLQSTPGQGSTFTLTIPQTFDPSQVRPREAPAILEPEQRPGEAESARSTSAPPSGDPEVRRAPRLRAIQQADDDRHRLSKEHHVLLVVEDDESFARILYDLAHEVRFQCLIAHTAENALALAVQYAPSAIVLDIGLPDQSGLTLLDRLKRDARTRHIPVHVVSAGDYAQTALSLGAIGYMLKPVKREQLVEALEGLEARLDQRVRRLLIVEDDPVQLESVRKLLGSLHVETVGARSAAECLEYLKSTTFDCMVLDLSLPDASGYSLLETLSREDAYSFPPVIVYTGRDLSADEEQALRRYSHSIIIKGAKSPERLLDEVTLFLHQVVSELSPQQQRMLEQARSRDAILEGRHILIVEDDVRNVFALTSILEPQGAIVHIARNGREALEALERSRTDSSGEIDLVLMDVMMPEMDGLTATREIRKNPVWKKLPIIMLTAKAMKDDQEHCLAAGASDYMAKPLDVEKLLSLVRVWMPR